MRLSLKKRLRQYSFIRSSYHIMFTLKQQFGFNILKCLYRLAGFTKDYRNYVGQIPNDNYSFGMSMRDLYPCLLDKTETSPVEPTYFYQDTWAAEKIFQNKPHTHVDVGSKVSTIGIISKFVPTTMVDIRPLPVTLKNLTFKKGSITDLPFEDNSIESLSSLCVIEHIGLGRYGDEIDPLGSEKAISEMKRVVAHGGHLLISVPVDDKNKIYFNAHRAFTRDYVLELFSDFELVEEKYIYGNKMYASYEPVNGFGTGLFHFKKGK